jgi:hypothetical protein
MTGRNDVTTWTPGELQQIGGAEELRLASRRPDGSHRGSRLVMAAARPVS